MVTQEILNSHPVSVLKKEISKTNVKGYSKMKKGEVVELMLKNKDRFSHIKMADAKVRKSPAKKAKKDKKEDTHEMPDGTKMTGKTHTKDSKPVKKKKFIIKEKKEKKEKNVLVKDLVGFRKKKLVQKYTKLIDKEPDKKKKKDLSIEMNKKISEIKKK